jgi:hypothetical protein
MPHVETSPVDAGSLRLTESVCDQAGSIAPLLSAEQNKRVQKRGISDNETDSIAGDDEDFGCARITAAIDRYLFDTPRTGCARRTTAGSRSDASRQNLGVQHEPALFNHRDMPLNG